MINPFNKIWFWLLVLSIIGFFLSFIFFETSGQVSLNSNVTPTWIWILFSLSLIFFIIALFLYIIDIIYYYSKQAELNTCIEEVTDDYIPDQYIIDDYIPDQYIPSI